MFSSLLKKACRHKTAIIQFSFIVIAVLYSLGYFIAGRIPEGDQIFNYLRLKDASISLWHGQLPQFSFYTGTILGSGANSFYPWLLLLPTLLLAHFVTPITWWSSMIGVGMLLGLEVTFYASKTLYATKHSLWLTYIYCLSVLMFAVSYGQCDVNAFYAVMLAPLAIIGWIHWIRHGKWHMLTCGMTLLLFSHFPTLLITAGMLIILTLISWKSWTKSKIISAVKAFMTFLLCGAVVWLPIFILTRANSIYLPSSGGRDLTIHKAQQPLFIKDPFKYVIMIVTNMWGVTDLLCIVLAIIYWKRLSELCKKFILTGIFILVLNIHPLAIWLVRSTPLRAIQFMHRFSYFSHFMFSVVLVNILMKILVKRWKPKNVKRLERWIVGIMITALILGFAEIIIPVHRQAHHLTHNTANFTGFNYKRDKTRTAYGKHFTRWLYTNHDLASSKGLHYLPALYPDYYPNYMTGTSKKEGGTTLNMPKSVTEKNYRHSNHFIDYRSHNGSKTLPIAMYHQQNYAVKVNGKSTKITASHHYMRVPLKRGKNVVIVNTPIMWYRYVAMLMTVTGLLILVLPVIKKRRRHV